MGFSTAESCLRIQRADAAHLDYVFLTKARHPFDGKEVCIDTIEIRVPFQHGIAGREHVFEKRGLKGIGVGKDAAE